MGRVYGRPVCKRYAYRHRRALSSGVVAGSMVIVAPDSKMIRGDKDSRKVASSPEASCAVRSHESALDGGTGPAARAVLISSKESTVAVAAGLVAVFTGLVGDEPAVMGARPSFPNFSNPTVGAGCLVVVVLRRWRQVESAAEPLARRRRMMRSTSATS
jgi:hypothetical protein